MAVLEVDDAACFAGLNRGDRPSSVKGIQALNSLVKGEEGVVLHFAGVEFDRGDIVGRQHSSVKDELYAVLEAMGPSRGTPALGKVAPARGLPGDNKERARLFDEANLLLDLASDCGTRGLIGLRHTARDAPRVGSVRCLHHEQPALDIEEHCAVRFQLGWK